MLNISILTHSIKKNYRLWIGFTVALCLLTIAAVMLFGAGNGEAWEAYTELVPSRFHRILNINGQEGTLTGVLSSFLFAVFFLVLPLIYEVVFAAGAVAEPVENGMMTYFLAAAMPRKTVIRTQAYSLMISLFLMFFCTAVSGILAGYFLAPGELDIPEFLLLNLGVFCLHICISGMAFLVSCICNQKRSALLGGGGLALLFYLLHLLARLEGTGFLVYTSVFSLFRTDWILTGNMHICWSLPLLAIIGLLLYLAGNGLFKGRDLPL